MIPTARLTLRHLDAGDADWIARDVARPDVHRWLTAVPHPYDLSSARAFLARVSGDPAYWAILEGERPQGVVSLLAAETDRPDGLHLGYWLAPRAWGRGLMTEAGQAVLQRHFSQGGGLVHSGWIAGNSASERVLTKLGFQRSGRTRPKMSHYHGKAVPVVEVVLPPPAAVP